MRQQPPGVVAVPPGPPVERHRQVPDGRGRLPLLRQPASQRRVQRLGRPLPPPGPGVAPGEERAPHPPGHVWQAAIASRAVDGAGCPECAGKQVAAGENDLATLFPHLAQQWDRARNGAMTPETVSPYSNRKAWWVCALGHRWQAAVSARAGGSDCPYCAGRKVLAGFNDLATKDPTVAAEWDPTLNGGLTPQMVTAGSHKKVWWRCSENHVWKAVVYARTGAKHCGCPVCAGKVSRRNQVRDPIPTGSGARTATRQKKEESL